MFSPLFLPAIALLIVVAPAWAQSETSQMSTAEEEYRAGDLDGALKFLEPLLTAGSLDPALKSRARELAVRVLQLRGEEHFRQARIKESIADFDRQIELQPEVEPDHWQRGIAYYYAEQYEKGARQFELHRKVNPQDVENAAWHFLCIARGAKGSVDEARKRLIPVTRDSRIPMTQIQQMFAGTIAPEDVLRTGEEAGGSASFYANLYVGLYYEALHRDVESIRLITHAAENPAARNSYMGDVARVHVRLRTKAVPSTNSRVDKVAQ